MSDDAFALTAMDRCQKRDCGAQAYVRAWISADIPNGDLTFCAHHWTEIADEWHRQGGIHYSELFKLEQRLDASA